MWSLILLPFVLQALAIGIDEVWFHRRRGLPKWERIGHPLDTLTVFICMGYVLFTPFSKEALFIYFLFAAFSCLMVTKDEFVHKEHCPASEQWLHAILFLLHPLTFTAAGLIWPVSQRIEPAPWITTWLNAPEQLYHFLWMQWILMGCFMIYQFIYWNIIWQPVRK